MPISTASDGRSRRRDHPDPRTEDHPEDERDREVEDEAVHGVAAGKAVIQRRLRPRQLRSGPLEDQLHRGVEQDAAEDRHSQEQRLAATSGPEQEQLEHDEERCDHGRRPDGGDRPHDLVERRRRPAMQKRRHDGVERDRLLAMDLLARSARTPAGTRTTSRSRRRSGSASHATSGPQAGLPGRRPPRGNLADPDGSAASHGCRSFSPILSTVSRPAARHGTRPELEAWRVARGDREATRCRSLSTA